MRRRDLDELGERADEPASEAAAPEQHPLVKLQQSAGNRAVTALVARALLQRDDTATAPAPAATLPSADELTARIARCIGIWETNRGGTDPAPKESSLDTVSGVHASYATIEQATEEYTLDALKNHAELRKKATPELTKTEIDDALARAAAVKTLLTSVASAAAKGTSADDFIKNNTAVITPTGLTNDNVKTMFAAVDLKATIDTAHAEVAAKKHTVKEEIDAIAAADRLGLGEASLSAYIKDPKKWGENRAAWQRAAVEAMPNDVGKRIKQVAESDKGTALATPIVHARVDTELKKSPQPSEQDIVETVGQKNNPGETDYGTNIWKIYQKLYPAPAPAPTKP